MKSLLIFDRVSKSFKSTNSMVAALCAVSFSLDEGESCAIVGPSGSGKSTLLSLAAGLDLPSSGVITLAGNNLAELSEDRRAKLRLQFVGFVFQSFQLIPTLTALENIALPAELMGKAASAEAAELLDLVGLSERGAHYPAQLSGGEQQRVALARAFINKPRLILADEPTGSLDKENANSALEYMLKLNRDYGTALLLVTHDSEVSQRMTRTIVIRHGEIAQ